MEATQGKHDRQQNDTSSAYKDLPAPSLDRMRTYAAREGICTEEGHRLGRTHLALGYLRLLFGLAVLGLLWPVFVSHTVPLPWLALPVVGFGIAARVHGRVLEGRARAQRAVAFYRHGAARVADRWAGLRPRTTRVDTAGSLYAADLDLFGPGSLFELLCEARTSLGEDTLAAWLLAPAPSSQVLARQAAIADLRDRLDLREAVAAAPGPLTAPLGAQALIAWAEREDTGVPASLAWIAPVLVALTLAAFVRWGTTHSPVLLVPVLIADVLLTFALGRRFRPLFAEAQRAHGSLRLVAALLPPFEDARFHAPSLQELQGRLRSGEQRASAAIQRLASLTEWIDARGNYVVRILDSPLLYSVQLALAVGRWKRRFGSQVRPWLEVLGELEALLSLAGYSYEHPNDPFPAFVERPPHGRPLYAAEALGHPLLPANGCVLNDVSLGGAAPLLLISGSNMSGKSTLLRSVGVNAVLAMAGAPVRATGLRLTPVHLAASIQVSDSLQAGRSRFYAEILRLRAVRDAATRHPPLLFLLDELLAGTNSHDRLAGADGLVRALLASGAFGLLTTHDLALTNLEPTGAVEGDQPIRNMHFEDSIRNGQLHFDYKLRPGIVERSNGLELMRMIGLDV